MNDEEVLADKTAVPEPQVVVFEGKTYVPVDLDLLNEVSTILADRPIKECMDIYLKFVNEVNRKLKPEGA